MDEHIPPRAGSGWIEVIVGSMYSGKTEELIRRLRRAQIARQRVEIFKPALDDRYARDHIVSHSELKIPSRSVKTAKDVLRWAHEAQGLDQDYLGRPFEPMPQLLAIAEYITKTLAICMVCGAPANRTYRKVARGGRVVVGGADLYEARCRRCFDLGRKAQAAAPIHEFPEALHDAPSNRRRRAGAARRRTTRRRVR